MPIWWQFVILEAFQPMPIRFFKTQAEFRKWLEANHDKRAELWLGLRKKASGLPSVTYKEAVDEALCFGWIDGLKKSIDEKSYKIRLSPRRPQSIWSQINLKRAAELKQLGLMKQPGLRAFIDRDPRNSGRYSFENAPREFSRGYQQRFKQNKQAWEFFQTLPPYSKRTAVFWITSAKKEETRLRRLQTLIEKCERSERPSILTGKSDSAK